jgi:hypothetical protein
VLKAISPGRSREKLKTLHLQYGFKVVEKWSLSTSDGTDGTDTAVALRNRIQDEFNSAFNRANNYRQKSRL